MPKLSIQIDIRPRLIQVAKDEYEVEVYFGEEFAFVLPVCYNDYEEAEQALKEYILGKVDFG